MAVRYATSLRTSPKFTRQQAAVAVSTLRSGVSTRNIPTVFNLAGFASLGQRSKLSPLQCGLRQLRHELKMGSCPTMVKLSFRVQARHSHGEFGETPISRRLILYSKEGCCLCDGVKEKLEGLETTAGIHLEVRDITTNPEWWNAYQYEVPVLARQRDDGVEVPLPRFSPRLTADQVQRKVHALMIAAD